MNFVVLTIFPELTDPFFENGMIKKAIESGIITGSSVNIRDFAPGKHKVTDDKPYGGGSGMVMKPEPIAGAVQYAKSIAPSSKTVLLTPQGRPFNQKVAKELAEVDGLIFVCGRYEGVDERVCQEYIDEELSIGDYVMTGGELASMVVIDAVARLIPGVLGGDDSAEKDSFTDDLLEHGHYTRPYDFHGNTVPDVLLSGNHSEIDKWRYETSLIRTFLKRPDLLQRRDLDKHDKEVLKKWCREIEKLVQT